MTYIIFLDSLVGHNLGYTEIFFLIQILLAFIVFYQSVWQRANQLSFRTLGLYHGLNWAIVKLGQLGLYIHMMICIIAMIDGFENLIDHSVNPHLFLLFLLLGTFFTKINIVSTAKKI